MFYLAVAKERNKNIFLFMWNISVHIITLYRAKYLSRKLRVGRSSNGVYWRAVVWKRRNFHLPHNVRKPLGRRATIAFLRRSQFNGVHHFTIVWVL
jgi:hypothetical protein